MPKTSAAHVGGADGKGDVPGFGGTVAGLLPGALPAARSCSVVLLRLVYLSVTNVFGLLRLLPDGPAMVSRSDRAFLAALLHRPPRDVLGRFRLLVRPETVLRWHRDLLARRHAARSL